jgi:RND family efflux transporter MFP subunit
MKIRRIAYWITAFAVVFVTLWLGYIRRPAGKVEPQKPVPVEVETVGAGDVQETIELTGWIKASRVVDVKSKVSGRIESLQVVLDNGDAIPVEEGLPVGQNQQLAVIDHELYLAEVAAAKANVKARQVELADAQREMNRIVALYDGGSATEQAKDKAATAAQLAAAMLDSAQAALRRAQINLQESTIVSPMDGIVTAKHIDEGNLINPGERIVTIADMKTVKVIVAVSERQAPEISGDTLAQIRVDAFPEEVFAVKVHSIYPALDPQTHTVQAEIRLKNDRLLLKAGMFARVTMITKRHEDVVVVPRDVILGGKIDKPYVYVIEEKDDSEIARKREVQIGIIQADMCEITDGLKTGETLVVNGMHYLTDGISVELVRMQDIK